MDVRPSPRRRGSDRIAIVTNVEAGSGGRETSQHASTIWKRPRSARCVAAFLRQTRNAFAQRSCSTKRAYGGRGLADGQAVWFWHKTRFSFATVIYLTPNLSPTR